MNATTFVVGDAMSRFLASAFRQLRPRGFFAQLGRHVRKLDQNLGTDGVGAIPVAGPTAIALQPDGKILIAAGGSVPGLLTAPPGLTFAFPSPAGAISRYNTNGSIDTTFGISGQAASVAVPAAIATSTRPARALPARARHRSDQRVRHGVQHATVSLWSGVGSGPSWPDRN